jgi:hypothetical protein
VRDKSVLGNKILAEGKVRKRKSKEERTTKINLRAAFFENAARRDLVD